MFFALHLLTEKGRHFGNMLLFVVDGRLNAHPGNNNFALFAVVKGGIQRHKTVARFLFQTTHLLQTRKTIQRTQGCGGDNNVRNTAPQQPFQLIADTYPHAVKPEMQLPFALFPRRPFGHRRTGRLRQRRQPPEFALRLEHPQRAVHLQNQPMQAYNVMAAGFLT
ncbi:Uncharacterised protein [Shigella sonnei]|nr:Uncharacterised protein [Shigella sonnei]CSF47843.1 Uncharacterised protein [Shigella sonnei]CSF89741.1 Uncharacterised protein [Shigella sonnei]